MVYERANPQKTQFLKTLGNDVRKVRMDADLTCERVAELLTVHANRDQISKLERGIAGMDMMRYLTMMWLLRVHAPDHPAVALARRLLPPDVLAGDIWEASNEAVEA